MLTALFNQWGYGSAGGRGEGGGGVRAELREEWALAAAPPPPQQMAPCALREYQREPDPWFVKVSVATLVGTARGWHTHTHTEGRCVCVCLGVAAGAPLKGEMRLGVSPLGRSRKRWPCAFRGRATCSGQEGGRAALDTEVGRWRVARRHSGSAARSGRPGFDPDKRRRQAADGGGCVEETAPKARL